jgi:hypothetical protein
LSNVEEFTFDTNVADDGTIRMNPTSADNAATICDHAPTVCGVALAVRAIAARSDVAVAAPSPSNRGSHRPEASIRFRACWRDAPATSAARVTA